MTPAVSDRINDKKKRPVDGENNLSRRSTRLRFDANVRCDVIGILCQNDIKFCTFICTFIIKSTIYEFIYLNIHNIEHT